MPHLVPVCFVFHQGLLYSPIDRKPKRVPAGKLARIQNIAYESRVALLVDHYEEDWTKLWYILIRGTAKVLLPSAKPEHESVVKALRSKYKQYAAGMLKRDAMLIRINPIALSFGRGMGKSF